MFVKCGICCKRVTEVHLISDIHQFSDSRDKIIHFYEFNQYMNFQNIVYKCNASTGC